MPDSKRELPPMLHTNALVNYLRSEDLLSEFTALICELILAAGEPEIHSAIHRLVRSQTEFETLRAFMYLDESNVGVRLDQYINCLEQMILCREVDSFLSYITELLTLLFEVRPEMLKSDQKVPVEFVIDRLATNDLIPALVERHVMEFSYKGMSDLCDYTKGKLGFPLFADSEKLCKAVRAVDIRNVIVHNGGRVNRHLIQRQPDFEKDLGQTIALEVKYVNATSTLFRDAATDIDARAIRKFKISTPARPSLASPTQTRSADPF